MASSPAASHSRSGYSAGPSRLRISQSYPNLGREASSSATPGPGPSSTVKKKKQPYLVRTGVSFTKFRSSSSVPNGLNDELSREQRELQYKLRTHIEEIVLRYRHSDHDDDEIDLSSETRYTPDGRVAAWRPDARMTDDGQFSDADGDEEDADADSDDTRDEDDEDPGSEESEDSEDELGDWREQDEAERKRLEERRTSIARLNDPFLSHALDDDELDEQFLLDEARRKARSRERSFASPNKQGDRDSDEDLEDGQDSSGPSMVGWGTQVTSNASDLYNSDASDEDDFASFDGLPKDTAGAVHSGGEEPDIAQQEDGESVYRPDRVDRVLEEARKLTRPFTLQNSRLALSHSPPAPSEPTRSLPSILPDSSPPVSNADENQSPRRRYWQSRLPTPVQHSPTKDKGKGRMLGERPSDSISPVIGNRLVTDKAITPSLVPMLRHTPPSTPVPTDLPSKPLLPRTRPHDPDAFTTRPEDLDRKYYYTSLYQKASGTGLRSCRICRRADAGRAKLAVHCRGRVSSKACVFGIESGMVTDIEADTEETPRRDIPKPKATKRMSTGSSIPGPITTSSSSVKLPSSSKVPAPAPESNAVNDQGATKRITTSLPVTPNPTDGATTDVPDPTVDASTLDTSRYIDTLLLKPNGQNRRCRVCATAKSDELVKLSWWCRGRISFENCGNKDINLEGYLLYRATSRYAHHSRLNGPKPVLPPSFEPSSAATVAAKQSATTAGGLENPAVTPASDPALVVAKNSATTKLPRVSRDSSNPSSPYWDDVHRVRNGGIKHCKACKAAGGARMWKSALCKGRMGMRFCAFENGANPTTDQAADSFQDVSILPQHADNSQRGRSSDIGELILGDAPPQPSTAETSSVVPVKRKRGRPPKIVDQSTTSTPTLPAETTSSKSVDPAVPPIKPNTPTNQPGTESQGHRVRSEPPKCKIGPNKAIVSSGLPTSISPTVVVDPDQPSIATPTEPLVSAAPDRALHAQSEQPKRKNTIKIARPRSKPEPAKTAITPPTADIIASPRKRSGSMFDVVIPVRSRSRTLEANESVEPPNEQHQASPDIRPQRLDFGSQAEEVANESLETTSLPPSSPPPDLPSPPREEVVRPIRPIPSAYRPTPPPTGRYRPNRPEPSSDPSFATPPALRSSIRGSSEMSVTPRAEKRTRFSLPRFMSSDLSHDQDQEADIQILLPRSISPSESGSEHEEDVESSDDELLLVDHETSFYRTSLTPFGNRGGPSSSAASTPATRPTWSGRLPPHLVKRYGSPNHGRTGPSSPARQGLMLPPPVPKQSFLSTPRSEPRPNHDKLKRSGARDYVKPNRARSRSVTEERVIRSISLGDVTIKTVAAR